MTYSILELEHIFLILCRIGAFLMVMPGFGSSRTPTRVRLFLAIVLAVAMSGLVPIPADRPSIQLQPTIAATYIAAELMTGAAIGMVGRLLFGALHFAANSAAAMIGLTASIKPAVEDDESTDAFAEMYMVTAVTLFFITNLHVEVILALVRTYDAIPMGSGEMYREGVSIALDTLRQGFKSALQVVAPFVVYSITVNFIFAVINKLIPSFPAFFISIPFVIFGGLMLSLYAVPDGVEKYMSDIVRIIGREFGE